MIPDFISHYYLSDRSPFLSLSDLEGDTTHPVFLEMLNKHQQDSSYCRRYGLQYLNTRRETERKLRNLFIEKGGKPKRKHPLYFVLGESKWFQHLNQDHKQIKVPLAHLAQESTSITYPDSFMAMTAIDKPYYEKVYLLDELDDLVAAHGLPEDHAPESYDKYWEGGFEKYIEVQIWADDVVIPYI